MLQYAYIFGRKYAVVYCLKMSQYVFLWDRKYAVVYWRKMLQYPLFRPEIKPLDTGLKCYSM